MHVENALRLPVHLNHQFAVGTLSMTANIPNRAPK